MTMPQLRLLRPIFLLGSLTFGVSLLGYVSGNLWLASLSLSYFYYSVFTLWHEVAHITFNKKNKTLDLFGEILIAPLLFLRFSDKRDLHKLHHAFTNNPAKDPDYSANNLLFKRSYLRSNGEKISYNSTEWLCLLLPRILFAIYLVAWMVEYDIFALLLSLTAAYSATHLIVNVYPHFRSNNASRNFGGNFVLTFLMLGNNYHGLHHDQPYYPWTYYLRNASKK